MKRSSCRSKDVASKIPLPFVRKYPFLLEVVRDLIVCSQYKYLTIITDGAINPTPNMTKVGRPRNNLVIEFDNGDIWKIEHSLSNLNIERYGALYFTNLNYDTMITCHPCNGYGNITLILSVLPYPKIDNTHMQPPHFCESGEIVNGALNKLEYWAGKYNILAPATVLLVPYIPLGYQNFRFQLSVNQPHTYWIHQYCCDDTIYCETTAEEDADVMTCIDVPIYSDRIYFAIQNRGLASGEFCMQATWIRKGLF